MTRRRWTQAAAIAAIVPALAIVAVRLWPRQPLVERFPVSTCVWSADGELLRITRSADDQYRVWVPLDTIAPPVVEAFLLKEDRWFYHHPGVNPIALVRAVFETYLGGTRQGGSTLTMQLARLTHGLNTRTPGGKLRQIAMALWLEAQYSKRDLLEAYLNVAPFGGNIQGVGAASWIYFGKTPDRISLGEALTLAVIPQRPARRALRLVALPASPEPPLASLLDARARLGALWLATHGNRDADRRQVELPIVARPQYAMPWQAPHLVDALLAGGASHARIDTTIEMTLQRVVEQQIHGHLRQVGARGIHNATALVADTRDMSVKAWVGSADYWNASIDGQVNGVSAKRSPGSTLKPFAYALALDQGILHPKTILKDAPTAFGPFTPENFDGQFLGPITAEDALIRSRNIPAVWVSMQLKQPSLYQFLQSAGVRDMKSESHYGLALALGGGEVTMEELATLYAMLANQGVLRPLRVEPNRAVDEGVRLVSPEAAFVTIEMLRRNPRPDSDGSMTRARWPIAWKTGTSWGFRDAWSAGIVGPYVLVVWIGNFEGQGNPAFVGVEAAAPLFFRIADALNLARASESARPFARPPGVSKVAVCAESGDLPNADCPRSVETWYIPGKSPIKVSQLHRAVAIDARTGRAVCPPYPPDTRFEVYEFWPSDMLRLFRQAGTPRRTPPVPPCAGDRSADGPRIASPLRNVSYTLRQPAASDTIALEAAAGAGVRRLFWFDGAALIGARQVADGPLAWRPATPGVHLIRVVDDQGRSAERDVDVRFTR